MGNGQNKQLVEKQKTKHLTKYERCETSHYHFNGMEWVFVITQYKYSTRKSRLVREHLDRSTVRSRTLCVGVNRVHR